MRRGAISVRHFRLRSERMSDVLYLVLGLVLIGAMAVYASALTGA